ncbi:MAG: CBS domain-containing protein [Thermoleophilaceae bacterium]
MLALTDYLGQDVFDAADARIGVVADLAARLGGPAPRITRLIVRAGRREQFALPWEEVADFERSGVVLRRTAEELDRRAQPAEDELLLLRDLVDTQIVDVAGRRLVRAGDVDLERRDSQLVLAGVDVGGGALLRRLGLRRLARRFSSRCLPWSELYAASPAAHTVQLRVDRERVAGLGPAGLAQVIGRLPPAHGADVLRSVGSELAADAVSGTHPEVGGRVVGELGSEAAPIVESMAPDDAAAALRHLQAEDQHEVLERVATDRAGELRQLLSYPSATAGALMSPDPLTAPVGSSADELRQRLATRPPSIEALATIFVVDAADRVVGVVPPTHLLAGSSDPVPVPVLSVDQPVDEVIALFALNDVLALPVVNDAGTLVGAVTIDDVLDELLAERLPGTRRFGVLDARRHAPS